MWSSVLRQTFRNIHIKLLFDTMHLRIDLHPRRMVDYSPKPLLHPSCCKYEHTAAPFIGRFGKHIQEHAHFCQNTDACRCSNQLLHHAQAKWFNWWSSWHPCKESTVCKIDPSHFFYCNKTCHPSPNISSTIDHRVYLKTTLAPLHREKNTTRRISKVEGTKAFERIS